MSLTAPEVSEQTVVLDERNETTMRAIVQRQYGRADVLHLQEIERPVPGPDEVLFRVRAGGPRSRPASPSRSGRRSTGAPSSTAGPRPSFATTGDLAQVSQRHPAVHIDRIVEPNDG